MDHILLFISLSLERRPSANFVALYEKKCTDWGMLSSNFALCICTVISPVKRGRETKNDIGSYQKGYQ